MFADQIANIYNKADPIPADVKQDFARFVLPGVILVSLFHLPNSHAVIITPIPTMEPESPRLVSEEHSPFADALT